MRKNSLFFSKNISGIQPSQTLEITALAKNLSKQGHSIVNLAAGEPDFDTPSHIKEAAISSINSGFTKYTPTSGILELREAICEKLKTDNNLEYEPSQIVVTCGAKHAIFNALEVICNPNDEVIIFAPYWVSYPELIKITGAKPVIINSEQSNNFIPHKDEVVRAITDKTKAIILNSPSNPTGGVYPLSFLEFIAKAVIENNLFLISDEIYEKIIFNNLKHVSIASLNSEIYKRTILINGVSKTYSMTGWRIGYLAADKKIAGLINNFQSHTTSCASSISQKAALCAISSPQNCIEKMVKEFEIRRDFLVSNLGRISKFSFLKPQGSFYLFCNISETKLSPRKFCLRMLEEKKIACIPGEPFGSDKHIRISFACKMKELEEGVRRLREFVDSL